MSELLYNALFNEGSYTKSYDDFKSDFATPENQLSLYEALKKEGAYTNSKGDFLNDYFPVVDERESEVTTVETTEEDITEAKSPIITESGLDVGSLKLPETTEEASVNLLSISSNVTKNHRCRSYR